MLSRCQDCAREKGDAALALPKDSPCSWSSEEGVLANRHVQFRVVVPVERECRREGVDLVFE